MRMKTTKIFGIQYRGWSEELNLFKQDLARMQGLEWFSWFILKPMLVVSCIMFAIFGGV